MGVSVYIHATAALPPEKSRVYPLNKRFLEVLDNNHFLDSAGSRTTIPRTSSPWPSHYTDYSILVRSA
jgi:hypothetical protein